MEEQFTAGQLDTLAKFLKHKNPSFDRERWLDYVARCSGSLSG